MKRLWLLQLLSLFIAIAWAVTDPLFESLLTSIASLPVASASRVDSFRVTALAFVTFIAISSASLLFVQILGSSRSNPKHRSVRSLLSATAIIAVWCSLAIHHESIAWQGKRIRYVYRVNQLESIVAPLREFWPERDGDLPSIGPFMAYPFGRPRTLILLQSPRVASQSIHVSAIERSGSGAIKLQLTGDDGGDWAEWHPRGSQPVSFTGGLCDPHSLEISTAIGGGWFLVRYGT